MHSQWTPPQSRGGHCALQLRRLPGGSLLHVEALEDCSFDEAGRAAVLRVVFAADPLPYAGFKRVFNHEVRIVLRAD